MRAWTTARDWLTVVQLPACAPTLNPVEGMGSSLLRTSLANIAFTDYTHLVTAVRRGPRQIQYRPTIITGCLIGTDARHKPWRQHALIHSRTWTLHFEVSGRTA